ncbi:FtsB family cell division protein [Pseudoalteromonas marina]|uniref:FtsB family cell division protein n=1 Tax=Pseudoalteromonas marina TaxID=267375 RepID=UPI003B0067DD
MKIFNLALLILSIHLTYTLFFSKNSIATYLTTSHTNSVLIHKISIIKTSNLVIKKRVEELKAGSEMVEEIAREELNLIKQNEVFINIID